MNEDELKERYNVILDAWNFIKKYKQVEDKEEYWDAVRDESVSIAAKYGNSKFAVGILKEVLFDLEEISRRVW